MTKEQLRRYRQLILEKKQLEQKKAEMESALLSPKAQTLDGMPRSGPRDNDRMADAVAKLIDIAEKYNKLLSDINSELLKVEEAIEGLKPPERTLLRYRYIDGLKWEEICVAMSFSWRQIHRIHAQALKELSQ